MLSHSPCRHAVHLALGLGLAMVPVFHAVNAVDATHQPYRVDPVVRDVGQIFDINVVGDAELDNLVSGPTLAVVTVPANASTDLLDKDLGFGQLGYDMTFQASEHL